MTSHCAEQQNCMFYFIKILGLSRIQAPKSQKSYALQYDGAYAACMIITTHASSLRLRGTQQEAIHQAGYGVLGEGSGEGCSIVAVTAPERMDTVVTDPAIPFTSILWIASSAAPPRNDALPVRFVIKIIHLRKCH
jgi:hypothetical protein